MKTLTVVIIVFLNMVGYVMCPTSTTAGNDDVTVEDLNSPNLDQSSSTNDDRSFDKKLWIAVSEVALHVEEFGKNVATMIREMKSKMNEPFAGTPVEPHLPELKQVCNDIGRELGECLMGQVEKVESDDESRVDTETTNPRQKLFKSVEKLFQVTGAIGKTYVWTYYGNLINAASEVKNADSLGQAAAIGWGALKKDFKTWTKDLPFVKGGSKTTEAEVESSEEPKHSVDVSQNKGEKDEVMATSPGIEHHVEETPQISDGHVWDNSMLLGPISNSLYPERIVPPPFPVDSKLSEQPKEDPLTVKPSNQEGDLGKAPQTSPVHDESSSSASSDQNRDLEHEKTAPPAQANMVQAESKKDAVTTKPSDKQSEVDKSSETSIVHGEGSHSAEKRNPEGDEKSVSSAPTSVSQRELKEDVATAKPSNNGTPPEQDKARDNAEEQNEPTYVGIALGYFWDGISMIKKLLPG